MGNLFPLILVGGATAFVVSKDMKKRAKQKCPTMNKFTDSELSAVSDRAVNKFKDDPDPAPEAIYIVNELLPEGCNRASDGSNVTITFQILGGASAEISVPELYIMIVGTAADRRYASGMITEAQYREIYERESNWYKDVTGSNLDMAGIAKKFDNLAKAIAESLINNKLKESDNSGSNECPSVVSVNVKNISMTEINSVELPSIAVSESSRGNKDALDIGYKVFRSLFPAPCTPDMLDLEVLSRDAAGGNAKFTAPEFFYLTTMEIIVLMAMAGFYSAMEGETQIGMLNFWWEQTVGNSDYPRFDL